MPANEGTREVKKLLEHQVSVPADPPHREQVAAALDLAALDGITSAHRGRCMHWWLCKRAAAVRLPLTLKDFFSCCCRALRGVF